MKRLMNSLAVLLLSGSLIAQSVSLPPKPATPAVGQMLPLLFGIVPLPLVPPTPPLPAVMVKTEAETSMPLPPPVPFFNREERLDNIEANKNIEDSINMPQHLDTPPPPIPPVIN